MKYCVREMNGNNNKKEQQMNSNNNNNNKWNKIIIIITKLNNCKNKIKQNRKKGEIDKNKKHLSQEARQG